LKIGWFTDTFYPQYNGVVTSIESFGKELTRRGYDIEIFSPKSDRKECNGMKVHSVPSIPFRPYPGYKVAIPLMLKVPKLDIMHTHAPFTMGTYGLRVAKRQGIPKVGTVHTMFSEYVRYLTKRRQEQMKGIAWKYIRYHYNKYDVLTTPSKAMAQTLEEHGVKPRIEVIPNGVDLKFLKPVKNAKEKLGLPDEKIILTFGRVSFEKNIDQIIKAMKSVPDSHLVVAGSGPSLEELKKLPGKLGIKNRVTFTGFVDGKLKSTYFSAADAFVIASNSETQGLVVLESMACGTPVIGADAMALPELIENGKNGWLYKHNDISDLTKKMKASKKTAPLSRQSIKTANKFSIKKMTDKLEHLYNDL